MLFRSTAITRALTNAFNIGTGATLNLDAAYTFGTLSLSGNISGNGNLTAKATTNTAVVLAGNVNINGTTSVLTSSTLQVGNSATAGTLASASVNLASGAVLRFDRSDSSSFASPKNAPKQANTVKAAAGALKPAARPRATHSASAPKPRRGQSVRMGTVGSKRQHVLQLHRPARHLLQPHRASLAGPLQAQGLGA